jgi:uncharacterized membrane protein YfcA
VTLFLLLALAGFIAGVINAIAGGGSLISFPALLLTGMPAVTANATNSLAVWPGSITALFAYRKLVAEKRRTAFVLAWPSLIGSLAGSFILLHTSERAFRAVVPWLILFACALLSVQDRLAAWMSRRAPTATDTVSVPFWLAHLAISVYGGYFGAGMGILMLAAMAIALPDSLQHANALKVLLSLLINGVSVIYFIAVGAARLPEAAFMAVCALGGGYVGARIAMRLPARWMRALVISYGVAIALYMLTGAKSEPAASSAASGVFHAGNTICRQAPAGVSMNSALPRCTRAMCPTSESPRPCPVETSPCAR